MVHLLNWKTLVKLNSPTYRSYCNTLIKTTVTMPKEHPGKPLGDIVTKLTDFAPLKLAENWDNVGLLVDPMMTTNVSRILLTNDTTEEVVDEAESLNAGLIVSYHPNIFQGLKSLSAKTWKERIVIKCLQNNIAIYSPHTTWDSVQGGVNDWLSNAFDCEISVPIQPNDETPQYGLGRLCNLKNPIRLIDAIAKLKEHIGIPHIRLAVAKGRDQNDSISSVALCAGSGSSVLKGVKSNLYLTGEMLHHDILEATQNGIHVILCNHSDSERGFLRKFKSVLQEDILGGDVEVIVSQKDRDPLTTV